MKSHLKTSHLVIKNSDSNGLCSIYVEISISGQQKRFPTGVKIKKSNYPQKKLVKAVDLRNKLTVELLQSVTFVERKVDEIIINWKHRHGTKPMSIIQIVSDYEGDTLKERSLFDYYDEYLEIKKAGSQNTYLTHSRTRDLLLEFSKKNKVFTFDNIDNVFIDKFRIFLENYISDRTPNGMVQSTVISRIEKLKEFVNYYFEANKHTNPVFKKFKFKKKGDSKQKFIVTLLKSELAAIEAHDFSNQKRLLKIRDYFLLHTRIGQRYEDFITLDETKFRYESGIYTLNFIQAKGKREVKFTLIPSAVALFEKYVVQPKRIKPITNSKYNNYLKEMLGEVAKKCPTLKEEITKNIIIGTQVKKETKYKYQWVTTHTARRTWINLALEVNVPVKTILSVTGHSKSEILDVYINRQQNQKEHLDRLDF